MPYTLQAYLHGLDGEFGCQRKPYILQHLEIMLHKYAKWEDK